MEQASCTEQVHSLQSGRWNWKERRREGGRKGDSSSIGPGFHPRKSTCSSF